MREANIDRLRRLAAEKRAAKPTEHRKASAAPPRFDEPVPEIEEFEDSLGEVDDEAADEAARDAYMRSVVDSLDVVRAYELFAGKGSVSGRQDSAGNIFVRCPTPGHEDKHPSAQVKPSTNEWVCHACGIGGDPVALVGAALGLDYHSGRDYMEITKEICRELGESFYIDSFGHERIEMPVREGPEPEVPVHGDGEGPEAVFDLEEAYEKGELTAPKPEPLPPELDFMLDSLDEVSSSGPASERVMEKVRSIAPPKKPSKEPVKSPETAVNTGGNTPKTVKTPPGMPKFNVGAMAEGQKPVKKAKTVVKEPISEPEESETPDIEPKERKTPISDEGPIVYPSIDWRNIIPQGTFIHDYCTQACKDDVIEEFHFWNALMAVSLACRRDLMLADRPLVYANLFVCAVAKTGAKKTKANDLFKRVLKSCGPLRPVDGQSDGIRLIPKPNSGEVLLDHFVGKREIPPASANGKPIIQTFPIAGLLQTTELSGLLRAAARKESTLEPCLIQMYDCEDEVTTSSRGSGTTTAEEPFLCLSAGVQPSLIRSLVSKDMNDSGFANRFVWIYGPPKERKALEDPEEFPEAVGHLGLKLAEVRRNVETAGELSRSLGVRLLRWDPEAERMWLDFFHSVVNPAWQSMADSDPASRAELIMKKLILIFTVNMGKTSVPPEAVEQAVAMWPYLTATYRLVGSNMTSNIRKEIEEQVISAIRDHQRENKGVGPTASEIRWTYMRNSTITVEELNRIIQSLLIADTIEEMERKRGRGRPAKRYVIAK